MNYMGTLLVVRDMSKSRQFYEEVLGLKVTADFGANVTMGNCVFLQTLETWPGLIDKDGREIELYSNACELYFEEDDFDAFLLKLEKAQVQYVHEVKVHSWGQRVVRFYDPDGHIIEVGENILMVVKRFSRSGMNDAEIAERMDVPPGFVRDCLK